MDRYHQLLAFVRIVETGSLSAAARSLAITPSGVSRTLTRLESRLNVRLFDRSTRALELTLEGRALYDAAVRALAAVEETEGVVGLFRETARGTLRVRCMPTFARCQLAPRLPAFLAQHPELRLEFHLANERVHLIEEHIDVAIVTGSLADSSYIVRTVARSRWVICGSPTYFEKHGVPQSPSELAEHNCLGFTMQDAMWNTWPLKTSRGIDRMDVRGNVGSNQGDLLLELAHQNVGIVRLAEFHIASDLESGRLVEILADYHDGSMEPIYAVYPHRRHMNSRVSAFLAFLEREFSGPNPWQSAIPVNA